jgi:hypothetical protein
MRPGENLCLAERRTLGASRPPPLGQQLGQGPAPPKTATTAAQRRVDVAPGFLSVGDCSGPFVGPLGAMIVVVIRGKSYFKP